MVWAGGAAAVVLEEPEPEPVGVVRTKVVWAVVVRLLEGMT